MISDQIKAYIKNASKKALEDLLAKYQEDDASLSPRDSEARAKLRHLIRQELATR